MPELPEIEHLRRTLAPRLLGATVVGVTLRRRDVLRSGARGCSRRTALLGGARIAGLRRRGKQLAIVADNGRVLCVHLGMSGRLWIENGRSGRAARDHVHCVWRLATRRGPARMIFRDPRRFGGLWAFDSLESLAQVRWSLLGPDALSVSAMRLAEHLGDSARAIKAALLDQAALAGVGNIYADEALFAARLRPTRRCSGLAARDWTALAGALRAVLHRAVRAGGSTLRDYRDANGNPGLFTIAHKVYGRAGKPCPRCKAPLHRIVIAQRSAVFCCACQPRQG